MDQLLEELAKKPGNINRSDITRLLQSIGAQGTDRELKQAKIRELYQKRGESGKSISGHHVADSLTDYEGY